MQRGDDPQEVTTPLPYLRHLDKCFAVQNESEVKKWCQKHKLDYSLPARLAFFILCREEFDKAGNTPPHERPPTWVPLIPRPWEADGAWRELAKWRHPELDLNLLQLAIVLKNNHFILYLWHPTFLREENYRDESGRLTNHPLHLLLALRRYLGGYIWVMILSLENIRAELLQEERTVDLTAARLQRHPSGDKEPDYPLVPLLRLNNLGIELASLTLTGTVVPFPDHMVSEEVHDVFVTILRKLGEPQARASTVEVLWQVQSDLSRRGFSLKFLHECDVSCKGGQFTEDVHLLLCQLYWAVKKAERWSVKDPKKVEESLIIHCKMGEKPFVKVCKFIPTEYLNLMIPQYRYQLGAYKEDSSSKALFREAADAMEDLLRKRTLQDHCVLSILDAVNGDARKVWGLSELPEPLKELFPLPFQELHKKLKADEQRPVDAPEQEDEL